MQATEALPLQNTKSININKTQKKKKKLSDIDKNRLWSILDQEKKPSVTILGDVKEEQVIPYTDTCPHCQCLLQFGEDGFPACIQPSCGYMAKYSLDYSPEWRYFASDQKNGGSDTTR